MYTFRCRLSAVALAVVAGAFCAHATAGVQEPVTIKMDCPELAGFFPVDYATARSLVPSEYTVVEVAPGKALLWLPIQDCTGFAVNGESLGPTPVVHVWIQVTGPDELVQVDGLWVKRDYFYSIAAHTTNNVGRQLSKQLGLEGQAIQSLTLGVPTLLPDGSYLREGGVVEKALGGKNDYGYRWQEAFWQMPEANNAIVHSFYHTKNAGKKMEADVRCLVWVYGGGTAALTVDPRSELAVFGPTLYGQTMDLTMHCDATMWQIK